MMNKTQLIGCFILVLLIGLLLAQLRVLSNQRDEIHRLESNIEAMRSDLSTRLAKDGKKVTESKVQTLTADEIRGILREELKSLDVKARDVKNITILADEKSAKIKIDTVILRDTLPIYKYRDRWIDLCVDGDSADIKVYDSLMIVNYAKTRRFLWWTWKKYSGKTAVKSHNPYSTITTLETIVTE